MAQRLGHTIRKWLGLRPEMSWGFYLCDLLFRRILRQNSGVNWAVHHTSTLHNPQKISRGKGVYPGDSPCVYINAFNGIEIGDYTNIGPNVGLISANHDPIMNEKPLRAAPMKIGRFCWLGKSATVLPGVELGDFTIVGAGAVVTKSFPEGYCVLAGNPARKIKDLNQQECLEFAARKDR